jgi:hypothetical protein
MVTFEYIGTFKGSCMSCGNETIHYMDSDHSEFCSKACVFEWHGDGIRESVTNAKSLS